MLEILIINGVTFPCPKGSFDIKYNDVVNEYESEAGVKTAEIIRSDVANISVSYSALLEDKMNELVNALSTVVYATFNKKGTSVTAQMKVSGVSTKKVFYKNNVSAWGLSFELEEL